MFLNVYVPTGGSQDKPILFWIYGGGYKFGANSLPLYNGTNFAANQDVIVVTTNYRTNGECDTESCMESANTMSSVRIP